MNSTANQVKADLQGNGGKSNIAELPPKQRVAALLKSQKNAINQVLPKHVSAERLMQVAFSAVRTTPKLLNCKSDSLIGAIVQCAQLGLEPNTALGHCYLIPFKDEAQIIVGYKGLIDLARRSGQIVSIAAHVVHENDEFEYEYGLDQKLRHVPADTDERGQITHAYAVAHFKDGGHAFEVMSLGDIHSVMLKTQSRGNYGPWKDHFPEMARKTAIRRLSKFLPLSIEFATAVAMDAQASNEESQNLDDVLSGEYSVVAPDDNEASGNQGNETAEDIKKRLREGNDKPIVDDNKTYDSEGCAFDPEFHVEKDGNPVMNQDGTFRKRPGKKVDEVQDEPPAAGPDGELL